MEAVGFSFYDFDFVVGAFYFGGVDGVDAVVDDAIGVTLELFGEGAYQGVADGSCQAAPVV